MKFVKESEKSRLLLPQKAAAAHQALFSNMLLVFVSRFDNKLACASRTGMFFIMSSPNTTLRSVVTTHTSWKSSMEHTLESLRDKRLTKTSNRLLENAYCAAALREQKMYAGVKYSMW